MKTHKVLALVPLLLLTLGVSPPNRNSIDDVRTMSFDVAVTDKNRIPVRGLDKDNFKVYVDNVEQTLTRVSRNNKPLAMVVLVELDEGFAYNMPNSVEPAVGLLKSLHAEDWGALAAFDSSPEILVDFTHDKGELMLGLRRLRAPSYDDTAVLYDAVYFFLHQMNVLNEKRAILLIGSGRDTMSSRRTYAQALRKAETSGTMIYTVTLGEPYRGDTNTFAEFGEQMRRREAEYTLSSFAEASGGLSFLPRLPQQYSTIHETIDTDLRNQYTLTFKSSVPAATGKLRKLRVEVANTDIDHNGKQDRLTVRHMKGY